MNRDSRSRKWQITINNPIEKDYTHSRIKDILNEFNGLLYWCVSDEVGNNKTYHTHIYIVANNAIRFSTMKNRFTGAHFEIARGTSTENRDYIFKLGKWIKEKKYETNLANTHEEWGEIPLERKGARNDLADLYEMIKQGMDNYEILENTPEHLLNIDKIERARQVVQEKEYRNKFRNLTITYIFGSTNLGKTRKILEKHGYENVYRVTNYKNPFDSYRAQKAICFEEFRSNIYIGEMLTYLEGYPITLKARYRDLIACYEHVYIISNIPLEKQYISVQTNEPATYKAFLRRIDKVLQFHEDGSVTETKLTKRGKENEK
ncbi:replication protein [Erysipelotrichaceae bacterium OttesenSCG-928-M19]|nr:replication protein [Erysipelotrichaceae bacterium OttesenSCG-928-M19]